MPRRCEGKMFNKVMAASLTAAMTMSLAGCGGNAATTEAPADTTVDQQTTTAETETTESEITVEPERLVVELFIFIGRNM